MFRYDKKPENINEAVSMILFLIDNTNSRTNYGSSSVTRALKDFANFCGSIKLSNTKELQAAIHKYFEVTKGDLTKYNERVYGLKSLFNWLLDKKFIEGDLVRDYSPVR